jgi:arabinofuranosyltransferase
VRYRRSVVDDQHPVPDLAELKQRSVRSLDFSVQMPLVGLVEQPRWRRVLLLALPGVALYLAHVRATGAIFIDDAYIFYRYAANWAGGHGLVFNVGEYVEGYSSLLWTSVLAAAAFVGMPPDVAGVWLGIVAGVGSILLLTHLAATLAPRSSAAAALVPLGAALSTGLATYSASGMDTVPFLLILLAAVAAAQRALLGKGSFPLLVMLPLLVIARAEAPLYAIGLLAGLAIARSPGTVSGRQLIMAIGLTTGTILVQLMSRLATYGEMVPATVLAKGISGEIVRRILSGELEKISLLFTVFGIGLVYAGPLLITLMLALWIWLTYQPAVPASPLAIILIILIVINLVVSMSAGGDWMPFHRHAVPVWPLVLLLGLPVGLTALSSEARAKHGKRVFALAGSLLLIVGLPSERLPTQLFRPFMENHQLGRSPHKEALGRFAMGLEYPVVGMSNVVGKFPYYAGPRVPVIDISGLVDRHNAKHGDTWDIHMGRTDYAYTYSRPFDLLMTNSGRDVLRLWEHASSRPGDVRAFSICSRPDWINQRFAVIVPRGSRIESDLARLRCEPQPLTAERARDTERQFTEAFERALGS